MKPEGKAVLLSIRPEWADKILTGEKTMEVRKTRPRLETPFKCYIYATKCRDKIGWLRIRPGHGWQRIDGMVIAEFVCDEIKRVRIPQPAYQDRLDKQFIEKSCLSYNALHNYCPEGDSYFWHISNLKIYPEPKPLSDFCKPCETEADCCACKRYDRHTLSCFDKVEPAPQSWGYVREELKNE